MKSKRPWKKHARIDCVEFNSGDVQFEACPFTKSAAEAARISRSFESLTEAEAHLDAWWTQRVANEKAEWLKSVKKRRPA